jgi:hypothetical protein
MEKENICRLPGIKRKRLGKPLKIDLENRSA